MNVLPPLSRFASSWWFVTLLATLLSASLLASARTAAVIAPLGAVIASALLFLAVLARRRGELVWCELGAVYVGVVTLYATYPLVGFLVLGQTYTQQNDVRLQHMSPGPGEMGRVGWLYGAHLAAFAASYLAVRGRLPLRMQVPRRPPLSVALAALTFYVAIEVFALVIGWFYDTSARSYIESYLVARRLPLVFAQLLGHLSAAKYPLAIVLLTALYGRYPRSRPVLIMWLALAAVATAVRMGSRAEFVLLVFAAVVSYHVLVRRIPAGIAALGAVAGIAAFVAFGILRSGSAGTIPQAWYALPFAHSSEFEGLFANALHLDRLQRAGVDFRLPPAFHFDGLAALVPQQIAPYAKFDANVWYVNTFFPDYAAAGGALAFGVIAQSVLTGGWISAMIRGATLGLLFAAIHRVYVRHAARFWVFVFYVWLTTLSYQSFRATSLFLVPVFVYQFMVVMIAVKITASLLDRAAYASERYGGQGHSSPLAWLRAVRKDPVPRV